ncbi:MAG: hypothetical protein HXM78_07620 [Neisseria lactamica]|nr:hypothetical protein [Neisseria lactamica]
MKRRCKSTARHGAKVEKYGLPPSKVCPRRRSCGRRRVR